jgi:hypothetical protein
MKRSLKFLHLAKISEISYGSGQRTGERLAWSPTTKQNQEMNFISSSMKQSLLTLNKASNN